MTEIEATEDDFYCQFFWYEDSAPVFLVCKNLTKIKLPNSLQRIGDYAFTGCNGLTEIIIPKSVTEIGTNAFSVCKSLKKITILGALSELGKDAFSDCVELSEIWCSRDVQDFIIKNEKRANIPKTTTIKFFTPHFIFMSNEHKNVKLLFFLIFDFVCAILFAIRASNKGRNPVAFFLLFFLVSPLLAIIILHVIKEKPSNPSPDDTSLDSSIIQNQEATKETNTE